MTKRNHATEVELIYTGILERLLAARAEGLATVDAEASTSSRRLPTGHPVRGILVRISEAARGGREIDVDVELGRLHGLLADRVDHSVRLRALADAVRADQGLALRSAMRVLHFDAALAVDAVQNHFEALLVRICLGEPVDVRLARAAHARAGDLGRAEGARVRGARRYQRYAALDKADDVWEVVPALNAARRALRQYLRRDSTSLERRILRVCWRAARDGEGRLSGDELARRAGAGSRSHASRLRAAIERELAALYRRELDREP